MLIPHGFLSSGVGSQCVSLSDFVLRVYILSARSLSIHTLSTVYIYAYVMLCVYIGLFMNYHLSSVSNSAVLENIVPLFLSKREDMSGDRNSGCRSSAAMSGSGGRGSSGRGSGGRGQKSAKRGGWEDAGVEFYREVYPTSVDNIYDTRITTLLPSKRYNGEYSYAKSQLSITMESHSFAYFILKTVNFIITSG